MESLPLVATILVALVLLVALYRTTRHRRPQWGMCSTCNNRTIFIHGIGRWQHVVGDYDEAYDRSAPHAPTIRPGSVHLRRT